MLQSKLFTKTRREAPIEEKSASAGFLLRAGFIDKLGAGIYTMLPLGLRVLGKIEKIIAREMDNLGSQRILMPALIPQKNWETSGRWNNFDALYKVDGKNKDSYGLGATHEEVVSPLAKKFAFSYKDLPFSVYQIQVKFRDELRAKSGLLRAREFLMKDMYSFHADESDADAFYQKVKKSYFKIFKAAGIGDFICYTYASGGSFSKFSHEFQMKTEAGEDVIFVCKKCGIGINREIKNEFLSCPECQGKEFREEKMVELANIFKLGAKYSEPFDFCYTARDGRKTPVIMSCFGIGLPRLMGSIVEASHDDWGIIWPKSVAPFDAHLISLPSKDKRARAKIASAAKRAYEDLQKKGLEVIFDDREDLSAGEKFKDCDLIGIPARIVISEKLLALGQAEIKKRNSKKLSVVKLAKLAEFKF